MRTRLLVTLTLAASFCTAQVSLSGGLSLASQIKNAKLETVAASGTLQQQIEAFAAGQTGSAWIGYSVPSVASHRTICCFEGWQDQTCCGTCHLTSEHNTFSGSRSDCDDVEQKNVTVLYHVEEKKVSGIRLFSENCAVDAEGAAVAVITGVDPKQSIAYLSGFVTKDEDSRLGRRALDAIAEHADASADSVLDRFASAEYPV